MKKRLAFLCMILMLCLLGGCGKDEYAEIGKEVRILTLAVKTDISSHGQAGVDCFAKKVRQISGGQLIVKVVESDDLLGSLDNGCELIFAPTTELVRANGNFNSYISPFYFYDYKHLTLTLNSKNFYDIIREKNLSLMNAMPIGAFYDGNSVILSSRDKLFDTVDQFQDSTVNILEDPVLAEVLKAVGATVKERSSEYLLLNFGRNRDNAVMECDTLALEELSAPKENSQFSVCKSFHRARVNWLVLSQPAKELLTSFEQAVLTEAVAYSIAANDELVLQQEQRGFDYVKGLGAEISVPNYGEFSEAADKALRASIRYQSLWDWDQHIEIRNLAGG
ncbi:hypothetical protein ACS3UN_07260 [Oscillospiraceae bacterium LTW-04]|nr:hypothetical protein RBH76_03085 [Oscillospiraceae bacterium MB24-C1]